MHSSSGVNEDLTMYFPSDMTFQYFFFDTYPGYFLQVFPIALIAGVIYGVIKYRNERSTPFWRKALSALFVCYVTGLICLVCLFDVIGDLWYSFSTIWIAAELFVFSISVGMRILFRISLPIWTEK